MSLPVEVGLPIIKELIDAVTEYQMCKEREQTKRLAIEAQLEACLTVINTNHEQFLRAMDDNRNLAMTAYDAVEKLLAAPSVASNPELLQGVLTFLQSVHERHSKNFIAAVNASPMRLPRIG